MSDLSKRFEELMARMARTDARLFRTIGAQNAALRKIAEDMEPDGTPEALTGQTESVVALAASSLLPQKECSLNQLKKRFGTLPPARAFLEKRLGAPPGGMKRLNWALVQKAVETGQWPAGEPSSSQGGKSDSRDGAMVAMEQRLERLEQRLERLELLLLQVLEQQSGALATPPH